MLQEPSVIALTLYLEQSAFAWRSSCPEQVLVAWVECAFRPLEQKINNPYPLFLFGWEELVHPSFCLLFVVNGAFWRAHFT